MAIDRTGIDSLEEGTSFKTGAPDLRLTGDVASVKALPINIQTYGNRDRPNVGINRPGGGRGQSPTGGDVAGTRFY